MGKVVLDITTSLDRFVAGVRLFESGDQIQLEKTRVIDSPRVTHLRFRVVR